MEQLHLESDELDVGVPWDGAEDVPFDCDAIADEDIERKMKSVERRAFHAVKLALIYVIPLMAFVIASVYVLNLILPADCRWLSVDDLGVLQGFVISVLSGVCTSLAVNYFYHKK